MSKTSIISVSVDEVSSDSSINDFTPEFVNVNVDISFPSLVSSLFSIQM